MTDMFAGMEESLSPREKWCRDNDVRVNLHPDGISWEAWGGGWKEKGDTREESINKLAQRLWIEKQVKPWGMQQ